MPLTLADRISFSLFAGRALDRAVRNVGRARAARLAWRSSCYAPARQTSTLTRALRWPWQGGGGQQPKA